MYQRVLLASDCSRQSLVALREGALIAQALNANVHLLVIERNDANVRAAEALSIPPLPSYGSQLLDLGLDRLKRLGIAARGEFVRGDPLPLIANRVRAMQIDLVVVGHQRQSLLGRWWSGLSGRNIVDDLPCSILIARDTISDAEFERRMNDA